MADREGDTWAFSRKGKLRSSDVFIGECGGHSPMFLKLRESLSKDNHAAREMLMAYSVTFLLLQSWTKYIETTAKYR